MALLASEFVHLKHIQYFIEAANHFGCHILVRKTGLASLSWIGQRGYTGKPVDMKAKTSDLNVGQYLSAGLVCSPKLRPEAFSDSRLYSALKLWAKSAHLITVPDGQAGFRDDHPPRDCHTPYILQTNPKHKHYGCVAFVEKGLLPPQYVHGDYDLYDVLPAKDALFPSLAVAHRAQTNPGLANAPWAVEHVRRGVSSLESPLLGWVEHFLNSRIASSSNDRAGTRMVNHGEQVNLGGKDITFEPVLVFMAKPTHGEFFRILENRMDHADFYRSVSIPA